MALRFIRIARVNDQLERASIAQSHRGEMTNISRCDSMDAESLGERNDGCIDKAKAQVGVSPVDLHGPSELIERRWSIGKGPSGHIAHEHVHCGSFIAKEVVDFR